MSKKLKAMVMAAGLGSRLEPITLKMPKPLIPIMNTPIMDIILTNLKNIGIDDVIANTYYLSEQIINRYKENNLGINFNYITEESLSGTAGGVKKCQFFFDKDEDFVVLSGDVLTNADVKKGIEIHKQSKAIATIGVKEIAYEQVSNFGVVVTDKDGYITEFQEKPSIEDAKSNLINTGIYIFSYKIFDYIPENTFYDFAKNVFPKLLEEKLIDTFVVDEYWNDIGTLKQYKQSIQDIFEGKCKVNHKATILDDGKSICGKTTLPTNIKLEGYNVIGNSCSIEENVTLTNCIILDNAEVKANSDLSNCIILPQENPIKTNEVSIL